MYLDDRTHRRNNFICIGMLMISLISTIILRLCLMIENRRRDRLSTEQYNSEAAIDDPCDWVSACLSSSILYYVSLVAS